MNELLDVLEDEESDMGSLMHSGTQAKLTGLLINNEKLSVFTELSLDVSQHDLNRYRLNIKNELKPDICAYKDTPPTPDEEFEDDLITVSQMPDLAIEVLSPSQSVSYLVRKIKAYFALGVRSCWLVMPSLDEIRVFSQADSYKTFALNDTELFDEVMDIHLPIAKVLRPR